MVSFVRRDLMTSLSSCCRRSLPLRRRIANFSRSIHTSQAQTTSFVCLLVRLLKRPHLLSTAVDQTLMARLALDVFRRPSATPAPSEPRPAPLVSSASTSSRRARESVMADMRSLKVGDFVFLSLSVLML